MKQINKQNPDYSDYNIQQECQVLRKFLDDNNLWIPENFYENIRLGDVIEIYKNPPDGKQIYSNSQFKKICSYSEVQMTTIPFPKLFWRSDEIQLKLMQKSTQVALNENQAVPWDIENHDLIESQHVNKRTFEINQGWVSPCFIKTDNVRFAFVSAIKVNYIFEWNI